MSGELEVTRGRRWARHGGNALVALSMASVPGSCLGLCALNAPGLGGPLSVFLLACAVLWRLFVWGSRLREDQWMRSQLLDQLARRLAIDGLDRLDPEDPRRVARERVFWESKQHDALVALRTRFVVEPERIDLFDAVRARLLANRLMLGGGVAIAVVMILLSVLTGFLMDPMKPLAGTVLGAMGAAITMSVALLVLVAETLNAQNINREERRVFEQESRRIVTMAELAGGLTLADSMGDDVLVGALSAEVAQGGELEQAGEGA